MLILELLFYLVAGLIQDILLAWFYLAISNKQVWTSGKLSFTNTMTSYLLFYSLFLGPQFFLHLVFYALGGAIGTMLTVRYKKDGDKL